MNKNSIYNPHWSRVDRTMQQIYQDLIDHYNIAVGGEIVTQFSDKGTVHSYIDFYADHFHARRKHARMLEIGLMTGASMKLWSEYFYFYNIAGIDLRDGWNDVKPWQADLEADPNIEIHFGIDSTRQQVEFDQAFDIILDDGAHDWQSQFLTFRNYWPQLDQHGIYYIEDVESADSMTKLRSAILTWLGPDVTVGMSEYLGHKHGRADDQILIIKKL